MIEMEKEEILKWFREDLLPRVVKMGHFSKNGEQQELEACEFEDVEEGNGFASMPSFVKLTLKSASGSSTLNFLVKFQCQDLKLREKMRLVPQFCNEITMYTEVIPGFVEFLKSKNKKPEVLLEGVPKCYFSLCHQNPNKSILILEDLRGSCFKMSTAVTNLDLNHCLLAVSRLAEFHAMSYAMKFSDWEPFKKLKESWLEVWLPDDPISRKDCEEFKGYTALRGINYLLEKKDSRVPEEYLKKFRKSLEPIFDVLKSTNSPVEPLSVICHGDFNRNNVLYRYSGEKVSDAKLIDFQLFSYASPCLDLCFFMYMNTTLDLREKYFEDIFRHYYSVLIKTTSHILDTAEEAIAGRIPFQAFLDDFARVAIFGYVTVSFFLPMMMVPPEELDMDITSKTFKEMAEENYNLGGEVVSERIAEVIVDFYRRKFYA